MVKSKSFNKDNAVSIFLETTLDRNSLTFTITFLKLADNQLSSVSDIDSIPSPITFWKDNIIDVKVRRKACSTSSTEGPLFCSFLIGPPLFALIHSIMISKTKAFPVSFAFSSFFNNSLMNNSNLEYDSINEESKIRLELKCTKNEDKVDFASNKIFCCSEVAEYFEITDKVCAA